MHCVTRILLCYIHAISMDRKELFLELTQTAGDQIDLLADPGKNLRGHQYKIKKTAGGKKGRYVIERVSQIVASDTLPQEKDPLPVLRNLWTWKNPATENPAS